jgi:DNA repair protein RadA/Sms
MASGIDQNRLALIIAVLEKKRGMQLSSYDVYLKVTGGVFLRDPSVDLGIAAAIFSSYQERPISMDTVFIGELGLSGEIRPVPFLDGRLNEARKLGFKKVIIPMGVNFHGSGWKELDVIEVRNLDELIDILGG